MPNHIEDQEANRNPQRKTKDVDGSSESISSQIPPGDSEVVFEHGFLLNQLIDY
jgi:hypothetical protein